MTRTAGAQIGCQRPSRFWGLGCPKIYHEAEDTLGYPDNRETDMSEIGKSGREQLEGKKSIAEILDVAISFEKTARDFYRDLAPKVSKNIRWLVEDLAIEEQGHYDLFKSLKSRPDIETHLSSEVATPASDRKFSDAVLLPDLGDSPDDQEVLRYALYREHTGTVPVAGGNGARWRIAGPVSLSGQGRDRAQERAGKAVLRG
ncbi:ferritin family protein, partial [Thiolapillus sp.]|uniref:ferritin family protein n=1 Tax=Thiolapillus sp. TaxID=2017437 RepID=UPI00263B6800